jgi:hypothetical protein
MQQKHADLLKSLGRVNIYGDNHVPSGSRAVFANRRFNPRVTNAKLSICFLVNWNLILQVDRVANQLQFASKYCSKSHKSIASQIATYFRDVGNPCPINVEMEKVTLNGKEQWLKPVLLETVHRKQISNWFDHPLLLILHLARLGINSILLETCYLDIKRFRTNFHTHTLVFHSGEWHIRVPGVPKDTPVLDIANNALLRSILSNALRLSIIGICATGNRTQ